MAISANDLRAGLAVLALLGPACIIPDREIVIEGEFTNRRPVRIVEPLAVSPELDAACGDAIFDLTRQEKDLAQPCPQPPGAPLRTFWPRDEAPYFCACNPGELDSQRLNYIEVFAEDADLDQTQEPSDGLYAALLLEDPGLPPWLRAYPDSPPPHKEIPPQQRLGYEPLGRPDPGLRRIQVGNVNDSRLDLCNGAGIPLTGGRYYTVTLMVTDRPWFLPPQDTEEGSATPGYDPARLPGVPDLAAGATWDSRSFTFFCRSPDEPGSPEVNIPSCEDQCCRPSADDPNGCSDETP